MMGGSRSVAPDPLALGGGGRHAATVKGGDAIADPWGKLDPPLEQIHDRYVAARGGDDADATDDPLTREDAVLSLLLEYTGDLTGIERRGFRTTWDMPDRGEGGLARGDVALADLPAVASHADVVQLAYGEEQQPMLHTSVPEIRARGIASGLPYVWTVDETGRFDGRTGAGVVVGIIDSGIDLRHSVFLRPATGETRILRIWDQGQPSGPGSPPDTTHIGSTYSYGREYTNVQIDALIADETWLGGPRNTPRPPTPLPIPHRDCSGHGTHVASIAAGNGRAAGPTSEAYTRVGVAPGADLVVVKFRDLLQQPERPDGSPVPDSERLEHALNYIEEVARVALGAPRPVVINYSGGCDVGPHDGRTLAELWLARRYSDEAERGRVFVTSAGNAGDTGTHALVRMPSGGGGVEVSLLHYDDLRVRTDRDTCRIGSRLFAPFIDVWYPDIAPATLSAVLILPYGETIDAPALGGHREGMHSGMLGWAPFTIRHSSTPAAGGTFSRNNLRIELGARGETFGTGTYRLRFRAPPGTEIHIWCQQYGRPGLGLGVEVRGGDPAVSVTRQHTIVSPGSARNVVAVGAYDHRTGRIAGFSSRGPLVDYSGLGPSVDKPDLGAPGVGIHAALSRDQGGVRSLAGGRYTSRHGASMSAPHVTGVVALMLERNPRLSAAEVGNILARAARDGSPAARDEFGAGKVDAYESVRAASGP
jgi:subtilisin family serine protease